MFERTRAFERTLSASLEFQSLEVPGGAARGLLVYRSTVAMQALYRSCLHRFAALKAHSRVHVRQRTQQDEEDFYPTDYLLAVMTHSRKKKASSWVKKTFQISLEVAEIERASL